MSIFMETPSFGTTTTNDAEATRSPTSHKLPPTFLSVLEDESIAERQLTSNSQYITKRLSLFQISHRLG